MTDKTYIVVFEQKYEGCTHTIDCGSAFDLFKAPNDKEAKEIAKNIWGNQYGLPFEDLHHVHIAQLKEKDLQKEWTKETTTGTDKERKLLKEEK